MANYFYLQKMTNQQLNGAIEFIYLKPDGITPIPSPKNTLDLRDPRTEEELTEFIVEDIRNGIDSKLILIRCFLWDNSQLDDYKSELWTMTAQSWLDGKRDWHDWLKAESPQQ